MAMVCMSVRIEDAIDRGNTAYCRKFRAGIDNKRVVEDATMMDARVRRLQGSFEVHIGQ